MENQEKLYLESSQNNEFIYSPKFYAIMYFILSSCIMLINAIFFSVYGVSDFSIAMLRPLAAILFIVVTLKSKIRIRVLVITIFSFLHFGELI